MKTVQYVKLKNFEKLIRLKKCVVTCQEISNLPVRPIFGEIALLDRRPTRQMRLYRSKKVPHKSDSKPSFRKKMVLRR